MLGAGERSQSDPEPLLALLELSSSSELAFFILLRAFANQVDTYSIVDKINSEGLQRKGTVKGGEGGGERRNEERQKERERERFTCVKVNCVD